jgi:hypothetical protein
MDERNAKSSPRVRLSPICKMTFKLTLYSKDMPF